MALASELGRVLIVDDDPIARFICETHLRNAGYHPVSVESVEAARTQLSKDGFACYVAVVSDYRMPMEDGLVLLDHVRGRDPTLGVIIVTAEGEKTLVASSLRSGAVDFLEKPMSGTELLEAVKRAMETTAGKRRLASAADDVRQVADSQRVLLGQSTARLGNRFMSYFHPHGDAGGDFVAAFPLTDERFVALVSDVSGHDLQAAYRSAYLQGFARAMLGQNGSIHTAFSQINRLLLDEWNAVSREILSLAACAVHVDIRARKLELLNCGLPAPYTVDKNGWASLLWDSTASPLGWFDDMPPSSVHDIDEGMLLFWSDGLEDLAERLMVSPLALARCLIRGSKTSKDLLKDATDDIVCVELNLAKDCDSTLDNWGALCSETYKGSDHVRIDEIQCYYERTLQLTVPMITEASLHDILMCLRESLLNALVHGCGGEGTKQATVRMAADSSHSRLRMMISDDGPGHKFDFDEHEETAHVNLIDAHRGLVMIRNLVSDMRINEKGNELTMEFIIS